MRVEKIKLSLVESAGLFPVWMIFYMMGVLKAQGMNLPFQNWQPLIFAMLAIVLCCIHILLLYKYADNVVHGIKLSAHIYSYFVIMWLFTDKAKEYFRKVQSLMIGKIIVYMGRVSFFIYLTHCILLWTFSYLSVPPFWSLRWGLCVVLSAAMAFGCERICLESFKRYVGF